MFSFLRIHLWKYGFQIFFLYIFGIGGMYSIDKHGDYFQLTINVWKITATIQLGTIDYERNEGRKPNKTRVARKVDSSVTTKRRTD
jgi:hypothetical protein